MSAGRQFFLDDRQMEATPDMWNSCILNPQKTNLSFQTVGTQNIPTMPTEQANMVQL